MKKKTAPKPSKDPESLKKDENREKIKEKVKRIFPNGFGGKDYFLP